LYAGSVRSTHVPPLLTTATCGSTIYAQTIVTT